MKELKIDTLNFSEVAQEYKYACLVDLSWLLNRFHYAAPDIGYTDKNGQFIPTGHIYSTIQAIVSLSEVFEKVLLVADSRSKKKDISKLYKGNREREGYNIYNDLFGILSVLTRLSNVEYVKEQGYESDDIIASFVKAGYSPFIYGVDNDLLMTPGEFYWISGVVEKQPLYNNTREYLKKKYGLEEEWLPVWWQAVKGKSSNNMPVAVPRFPSKELVKICAALKDTQDWDDFTNFLSFNYEKKYAVKILDNLEAVHDNYLLALPDYFSFENLSLKRIDMPEDAVEFLKEKGMDNYLRSPFTSLFRF